MNGSDMIELEESGKTIEDLYDVERPEPECPMKGRMCQCKAGECIHLTKPL